MDSKLELKSNIARYINKLINSDKGIMIAKHNFIKGNVYDEYEESLKQSRYKTQKEKMLSYIERQKNYYSVKTDDHFVTGFIIRKNNDIINSMNEMWYEHIKDCGIECQISFFFIKQEYEKYIYPIEFGECYRTQNNLHLIIYTYYRKMLKLLQ
jgi:hypothetical protein